jgi:hypothetical protein
LWRERGRKRGVRDEMRREELGGRGSEQDRCQAVKWDRWKSSTEKDTNKLYRRIK